MMCISYSSWLRESTSFFKLILVYVRSYRLLVVSCMARLGPSQERREEKYLYLYLYL